MTTIFGCAKSDSPARWSTTPPPVSTGSSRRGEYDELDVLRHMRRLTEDITTGRFADEWDAERDAGHPRLAALKDQHCGPAIKAMEADLRSKLGSAAREG
jgi:ketol-acid reductoisomerase